MFVILPILRVNQMKLTEVLNLANKKNTHSTSLDSEVIVVSVPTARQHWLA